MTRVALGDSVVAAAHLVAELLAAGVRDVVLCPGSRSAPLAYALAEAERLGRVRLHVRHDERTAAFLALGVGKADHAHPAVVVTTSGTAVANLLPAAQEAHHARVPLLLLTADRPRRLRGTWANQTSDLQPRLFGRVAVTARDVEPAELSATQVRELVESAVDAARGLTGSAGAGPVQLNVCFDDPLQPQVGHQVVLPEVAAQVLPVDPDEFDDDPRAGSADVHELPRGPRTVVVAGDGAGLQARELAEAGGWPLLAEPTSGSRAGACLINGYRVLLPHSGFADQVERVVVFGRPTLSRPVTRLIEDAAVQVVQVAPDPNVPGPGRPTTRVPAVAVAGRPEQTEHAWLRVWRRAGDDVARHLQRTLAGYPLCGPAVARAVVQATEPGQALVIGASNPIRDADLAADEVAEAALVLANRGLSGIDGTLSTALGVAAASGRPTRVLLGDLTFLHDLAALALPSSERDRLQVQVIVFNDDGGGIFTLLEHGEHPDPFERVFGTPVGAELGSLATGYGIDHRIVRNLDDLLVTLRDIPPGVSVVEVPASRGGLRALHRELARPPLSS